MPKASYTVHPQVFQWFGNVKYPYGYAGNIAQCVKMGENKISGLKTHDCHVLLQRLLPVVIRTYLQSDVVDTLVVLSKFFQRICAKELKKSDVRSLQEDIVYIMCKLERIFPPAFFDIMIHLMIHFPEQVLLTGPVQYTWCYPNESAYLNDKDTVGESSGAGSSQQFNLSVVSNDVQPYGRLSNSERLSDAEIKEAHWCVLQHCEEAKRYFKSYLLRQNGNEAIHKRDFPDYFPIWLHSLAEGPQSHGVHAGCFVNGVKFVTSERDEGHVTQNNGVMVEGLGFNYYGVLISVIELIYGKGMPVVLFKCKWFNTDPTRRRSTILDHGLLSVDSNSVWYENEPFILVTMAKQVFYLDDPAMGEGWKVVQVMSHRNIWSAATLGGEDDESGPSYLPITPSELNSLQRRNPDPNHDDDGFIDDEYIEDDEYSDQTKEDDDSDDSDYHEYD
ncbi:PREDICTED: uncharacterized protein LOC101300328 [Fragaria vesca subsp. vesca]